MATNGNKQFKERVHSFRTGPKLGDLIEREVKRARRTKGEWLRLLVEDALKDRRLKVADADDRAA